MREKQLTELQATLLEILQEHKPDWLTRKELSDALGLANHRTFVGYYTRVLEDLEDLGYIEIKTEPRGVFMQTYFYRAI